MDFQKNVIEVRPNNRRPADERISKTREYGRRGSAGKSNRCRSRNRKSGWFTTADGENIRRGHADHKSLVVVFNIHRVYLVLIFTTDRG